MAWTNYKVVLRLLTPLHIGHMKLGNVQRTRPYVTGKALWGALTARLTRDVPALGGDYAQVGVRVNDELAFSYFYPTDHEDGTVSLWPWDDADDFAWKYMNTYASTALNYNHNSAEDGSLHETEFIAPTTRDSQAVNLVGYIFERDDCALPWRDALDRLQLGGERTYGWGRVKRVTCEKVAEVWDGWTVELDNDKPVLRAQGDTATLYAHLDARTIDAIQGRVEPLVGRETKDAGAHGKELKEAKICWMPGATVAKDTTVQIGAGGIWQMVES